MSSILFVDASVENREILLAYLKTEFQVYVIPNQADGIQFVTETLLAQTAAEVHLVAHGSPGCLYLGNAELSLSTLGRYGGAIATWPMQSLLLYGCRVALGDAGEEFVEKLHRLTGAEVFASTTSVGHAALGGDWLLDVSTTTDAIAELALTPEIQAHYPGILANPVANDETVVGNVRQRFSFDVTKNDTDADGNGTLDPTSIQLIDPNTGLAAGNTVAIAGKGTYAIDPATNRVTFEPEPNFSGNVSIKYTVDDIDGNTSNQATVTTKILHPCEQIDIWFGNDESGSVDGTEFNQSRVLMAEVAARLRFGNDGANAALFTWASGNQQSNTITRTGDQTQFANSVANYSRGFTGGTDIAAAINFGVQQIQTNGRPGVDQILVILTDASPGQITGPQAQIAAAAAAAKALGITLIFEAIQEAQQDPVALQVLKDAASLDKNGDPLVATAATYAGISDQDIFDLANAICGGSDSDNDGQPDFFDTDDDDDGILDIDELDGLEPDFDDDADGMEDLRDADTPGFIDINNDGLDDRYDSDLDGVPNHLDPDADNDGIYDVIEAGGIDADQDGRIDPLGDGNDDEDNDGLIDRADPDDGGVAVAKPDTDGDGILDFLDLDSDNDGIADVVEAGGVDADGDGRLGNGGITDADGDGMDDSADTFDSGKGVLEVTTGTYINPPNSDSTGKPNYLDLDSDDDGIPDNVEAQTTSGYLAPGVFTDTDGDGLNDVYDGNNGGASITPVNTDAAFANPDATPDYLDTDSDGDGDNDTTEAALTPGADGNGDGIGDNINASYADPNGDINTPPSLPDVDFVGGDVDYRDDRTVPDAVDDGPLTVAEDQPLVITPIGNDTDADGDDLTVTAIDGTPIAPGGAGVAVTGGTVTLNGAGKALTFTPNSNYTGPADFTYRISDDDGGSDTATVDLEVLPVNDPPVLDLDNDGLPPTGDEDYATVFQPGGAGIGIAQATGSTVSDVDGDLLTLTVILDNPLNGAAESLALAPGFALPGSLSVTPAANGLIVAPSGVGTPTEGDYQAVLEAIEYDNSAVGPDRSDRTITVTVDDGQGQPNSTATATTTIRYDTDGDGITDAVDLDDDNDGILDTVELATAPTTGPNIGDTDGDGIIDSLDLDADNDGILDVVEARHGGTDADGDGQLDGPVGSDGVPDQVQANPDSGAVNYGNPVDTDNDGQRDFQDLDSDNDSLSDVFEGASGGTDADDNGVLDGPDSDGDGIVDSIDGPTPGFGDGNGYTAPPDADSATDADSPDYIDVDSNDDGLNDINVAGNAPLDGNGDGSIDDTTDNDNDGIPDLVDDSDLDGTTDPTDPDPQVFGGLRRPDADKDGILDQDDLDDDNDGILDTDEERGDVNRDTDGDGILDRLDLDADNDGITDLDESGLTPAQIALLDADGDGRIDGPPSNFGPNGFADAVETAPESGVPTYNGGTPVDTDGDTTPDFQDLDSDNDGLNDVVEAGGPDTDGDGLIDGAGTDADGDGLADVVDPTGSTGTPLPVPDTDADGVQDFRDLDSDNDGLPDLVEGGIDPAVDVNSDGVVDGPDTDGDGIQNSVDDTPGVFGDGDGPESDTLPDGDNDDTPDYLEPDSDGDGIPDRVEAGLPQGPTSPDPDGNGIVEGPDSDGDGVVDAVDSLPSSFGGFEDTDGDGIANFKDLDDDNDGILDTVELATAPTTGSNIGDTDGDGIIDSLDLDADNDGILDVVEARHGGTDADGDGQLDGPVGTDGVPDQVQANPDSGTVNYGNPVDTDNDGQRDFQDLDSDNDSLSDLFEGGSGGLDTDDNGVLDLADADGDGITDSIDGPTPGFGDGNGYTAPPDADSATDADSPDYIDVDSNDDGLNDIVVAGQGLLDGDGDGVIDDVTDVDQDGIRDVVDDSDLDRTPDIDDSDAPSFGGLGKPDADRDGIPDSNDLDDDNDGILDSVEERGDINRDTDGDGILDRLDLDADNDGILDLVEARHPGADANGDGQVDGPVGADGIPDDVQAVPDSGVVTYGSPRNSDSDANPDFQDLDSDNDSLSDLFEGGSGGADLDADGVVDGPDRDGDGIQDSVDGTPGFGDSNSPAPPNTDNDAEPDYTDIDSDNDGANDILEASNGDLDLNQDGVIDDPTDLDQDGIRDVIDDSDDDGLPDASDPTPNPEFGGLAPVDTDGDGVPDIVDLDDDNDGILDSVEERGNPERDTDGDGVLDRLDLDADNDGINDLIEAGHGGPDENDDGIVQGGVGADGVPDALQDNPDGGTVNYGDPLNSDNDDNPDFQDLDSDNDSLSDLIEGGSNGLDADGDGVVDGPDGDGDGVQDSVDGAPATFGDANSPLPPDADSATDPDSPDYRDVDSNADGLPDIIEAGNGVLDPNGDGQIDNTTDVDDDGIPDVIDDSDADGTPDISQPGTGAFGGLTGPAPDADGDGIANDIDLDDDNDGILDTVEEATAPADSTIPFDTDGDGIPDRLDLDSDNDGINDIIEAGHEQPDADNNGRVDGPVGNNGFLDAVETAPESGTPNYSPLNSDSDDQPDFQDLDSDNDSVSDLIEGGSGGADNNGDGVVDGPDTDKDGLQDSVDGTPLQVGDSNSPEPTLSDSDVLPDYRDRDSDDNGVDDIDQAGNTILDQDNGGQGDGEIDDLTDNDNDGILDVVDDSDQDGLVDTDPAETDPQRFGGLGRADTDGDGILNAVDLDDDNDGILDSVEERGDIDRDTDGDGILDRLDLDADNDGINDVVEAGHGQADADGDGILDGEPAAFGPNGFLDALETAPESGEANYAPLNSDNLEGKGDDNPDFQDIDSDNDSLSDLYEGGSGGTDLDNDGVIDGPDSDGDGVQDSVDANPTEYGDGVGPVLPNRDGDEQPDYRDVDRDNDGFNDINEADNADLDADGDGRIDDVTDVDDDGAPDVLDDSDGDGAPDTDDAEPNPSFGGVPIVDSDGDGVADVEDLDDDNDGILDSVEERGDRTRDTDGDGVLDRLDLDADNDSINDIVEAGHAGPDVDNNGILDGTPADFGPNGFLNSLETTPESGTPTDTPLNSDSDLNPDFQDLDSDNDSLSDLEEGGSGGLDANNDGVVDGPDADGDGIQDSVDGTPDTFGDSGSSATPDDDSASDPNSPNYRDPDRNADGVPDIVEAGNGILDPDGDGEIDDRPDLDEDGIPDVIDDSNRNGTPDASEPGSGAFGGLGGPAPDADGDGIANDVDLDDDNDGILDTVEEATAPANSTVPFDTDGDGIPDRLDLDSDNDGINDGIEAGHGAADTDGNGLIDGAPADFGANGFFNGLETNDSPNAAATYSPLNSDSDNQPDFQDLDADNDGLSDLLEGGGLAAGGVDQDDNGVLDGPDADKDGIPDSVDGNATVYGDQASPLTPDEDGDALPDYRDLDADGDGREDVDPDLDLDRDGEIDDVTDNDNDGIADVIDDSDMDGLFDPDPAETDPQRFGGLPATDTDGDGISDALDIDDDNDGILDTEEERGDRNRDTDGDGVLDRLDLDADNDGITDLRESGLTQAQATSLDRNGDGRIDLTQPFGRNGFADAVETAPESGVAIYGPPVNTDGDTVPDFQDIDSDNDGIPDVLEGSAQGINRDPDSNALIGEGAVPLDSDGDGLADVVDPFNDLDPDNGVTGRSPLEFPDSDGDGIADARDLDSDNDSFSDLLEAANPRAIDSDGDGQVDGLDSDGDGLFDSVDGAPGVPGSSPGTSFAADASGDGIPEFRQAGQSASRGTAGADIINGSDGDDILNGLSDPDSLDGGAGNDIVNGGSEEDVAIGGSGNDIVNGGSGNDRLEGNDGDDLLNGGSGEDLIDAGPGNDIANGGSGNDQIFGGDGDDLISGGRDEDRLYGQAGNDILRGDRGNDTLIGGLGNDLLVGGEGADIFRYESVAEFGDTIQDFNITEDKIDLSSLFNGTAVLGSNVQVSQLGLNSVLQADVGNGLQDVALILNTNASTLLTVGQSNFIL